MELRCPICAAPLEQTDKTFRCGNGHSFDMARQGYVNLLPVQNKRSLNPGDTLEQVSSIYGTDRTENGNELVYTAGKTLLVIIVENDTVTSIEFRADM